jgi:hypothetical protein
LPAAQLVLGLLSIGLDVLKNIGLEPSPSQFIVF